MDFDKLNEYRNYYRSNLYISEFLPQNRTEPYHAWVNAGEASYIKLLREASAKPETS